MPAANSKALVKFNIKNAAYAIQTSATEFGTPTKFGYSDSISLEANYSEKTIYGDGKVIHTIPNDKGKTGSLALLTIDEAYEIAMKRRMVTASGVAEIKQTAAVTHAIYFEFDYMDETTHKTQTAKTIVYGVTSGRPSETFNQTTEDINNNNISYPLTIKGVPLMSADGSSAYVDSEGNSVHVWQVTSIPGDAGYENFGKTVSLPKVSS